MTTPMTARERTKGRRILGALFVIPIVCFTIAAALPEDPDARNAWVLARSLDIPVVNTLRGREHVLPMDHHTTQADCEKAAAWWREGFERMTFVCSQNIARNYAFISSIVPATR